MTITHSSPSHEFTFQISYLYIHVPSNPYLFSSFRATCFMYSFPLRVPNARLKIYHRNSSTVSRNERRKIFGPSHELSSAVRISGFIILAQMLDISSFFSPTDFPIINCLKINAHCSNIQSQYRRPFGSENYDDSVRRVFILLSVDW